MKVDRDFHRPDVVQRLESMDEELLAQVLATTPVNEDELREWQQEGVMRAIAEMDAKQGIPHAEIVQLVKNLHKIQATNPV
ncbi:MAG: hypothetical protein HQL65_12920 [Magnetococcales bacterium]|nr:hypothetical protein [Magnetococcales bacterium]